MTSQVSKKLPRAETPAIDPRRVEAFEDRYGRGSHTRLLRLLAQPCVTFAEIAADLNVTRERVRQWQMAWLPDAPRGRERRRLCRLHRQRRLLLEEPLFRSFYRHVRPHLRAGQLALVPAREGFRKRTVQVNGQSVFIKYARPCHPSHLHHAPAYALTTYRGSAEFIYFRLGASDFLLLPARLLPSAGTTFLDTPSSKYQAFRNTIAALDGRPGQANELVSFATHSS